jgi:membrane protease YdiL (CAAX protease family)
MDDSYIQSKKDAVSGLFVLIGLCLLGMVVFSGIGIFIAKLVTGLDAVDIQEIASGGGTSIPGSRMAVLLLQGSISLGGFIAFPSLVYLLKKNTFKATGIINLNFTLLLLVLVLSLLMLPVNGWLAGWNESIHFPSFLNDFYHWARAKENEMQKLTVFLVDFRNPIEVVSGFIVISLIAGLSEEFFFRRMVQPQVQKLAGNPHFAIWFTAFIFSAIHFQFFGFIPRMALGALFGYYFYWTGNIWLPVFGHCLNNGITLIGMYLYNRNMSPIDVEDPAQIPWYLGAVAAGVTWSLATMVKEEADKIRKIEK